MKTESPPSDRCPHCGSETDHIESGPGYRVRHQKCGTSRNMSGEVRFRGDDCYENEIAALRSARTWRKEPPDVPGWWWWRPNKKAASQILKIRSLVNRRFHPAVKYLASEEMRDGTEMTDHSPGYASNRFQRPFYGEWSGPIDPPQPETTETKV